MTSAHATVASPKSNPHDDLPAWTKQYRPCKIFQNGITLLFVVAIPVVFAYVSTCEWNSAHYALNMNCSSLRKAWKWTWIWKPQCEISKETARCLPLYAISMLLIVTGRFVLQSRIYYLLLMKGALLDFQNYTARHDPAFVRCVVLFGIGLSHYVMQLWFRSPIRALRSIFYFSVPYIISGFALRYWCDMEKHLVTLSRYFESAPGWAKDQLKRSELYPEWSMRNSVGMVLNDVRSKNDYEIGFVLKTMIRKSAVSSGNVDESLDELPFLEKMRRRARLMNGLWPARVLMLDKLEDPESVQFKSYMRKFLLCCILPVHFLLFGILLISAASELVRTPLFHKAFPLQNTTGGQRLVLWWGRREPIHEVLYEDLGSGYCRDDDMSRPSCYWKTWDDMRHVEQVDTSPSAQGDMTLRVIADMLRSGSHEPRRLRATTPREQRLALDEPIRTPGHVLHPSSEPMRPTGDHRFAALRDFLVGPSVQVIRRLALARFISSLVDEWYGNFSVPERNKTTCAYKCKHLSDNPNYSSACLGFAVDEKACTIYTVNEKVQASEGWVTCHSTVQKDTNEGYIVQTDQNEFSQCWRVVKEGGEAENYWRFAVIVFYTVLIGHQLYVMVTQLRHQHSPKEEEEED